MACKVEGGQPSFGFCTDTLPQRRTDCIIACRAIQNWRLLRFFFRRFRLRSRAHLAFVGRAVAGHGGRECVRRNGGEVAGAVGLDEPTRRDEEHAAAPALCRPDRWLTDRRACAAQRSRADPQRPKQSILPQRQRGEERCASACERAQCVIRKAGTSPLPAKVHRCMRACVRVWCERVECHRRGFGLRRGGAGRTHRLPSRRV